LHPALPSCRGHDFWKRDFLGSSGLFSVLLSPCSRAALAAMLDGLNRHSPDKCRLKTTLRLFVVICKSGSLRTSVGRSEVEPNAEFAEFSVIKTHLSRGF
jgi:hypothetical protein